MHAWRQVPYFNAPIFLQNKTQIGKIEEIFGAINDGVSAPHLSSRTQGVSKPVAHALLICLKASCSTCD